MSKRPYKDLCRDAYHITTLEVDNNAELIIKSHRWRQDSKEVSLSVKEVEDALPFLFEYYQRKHYYGIVPQ